MQLSFLLWHFLPALLKIPDSCRPWCIRGRFLFTLPVWRGFLSALLLWGSQRHCAPILFQQYKSTSGRFYTLSRFHSAAIQRSMHFTLHCSAHSAPVCPVPRPAGAAIPLPVAPRRRPSSVSRLPAGSGQGRRRPPTRSLSAPRVSMPHPGLLPASQPLSGSRSHSRKSRKIVATKVASKSPRKSQDLQGHFHSRYS